MIRDWRFVIRDLYPAIRDGRLVIRAVAAPSEFCYTQRFVGRGFSRDIQQGKVLGL